MKPSVDLSLKFAIIMRIFYYMFFQEFENPKTIVWYVVVIACVEILRPSQPNGVMSNAVSLL